ncbi:unnamed protein product [Schistocephalus solidus]|uniref:DHC_N2 domain-containing protein n=1 Tax=Schistocephalus solidus TaxID=70667 RepID=A0A183SQ74_SCHSO|nr:unnamed protein product [Schistocephalus solidus]
MIELPLFKKFRLWKAFIRWRKVIRYAKMESCRRFLESHLFIANSALRPALLNVREMCYAIGGMTLCKMEQGRTYTLLDFLTTQVDQLSEVSIRLKEFHHLIREVIRSACRTALLEYGFMPDDYLQDDSDLPLTVGRNLYDVDELIDACKLGAKRLQLPPIPYDADHPLVGSAMKPVALALKQLKNHRCKLERRCEKIKSRKLPALQKLVFGSFPVEFTLRSLFLERVHHPISFLLEQPGARASCFLNCQETDTFSDSSEKMSFTEQANKRNKCKRLTCFIRLADYLIMSTLHVLTFNSIYALNKAFTEELSRIPNMADIDALKIEAKLRLHPEEEPSEDENAIMMPTQSNKNAAAMEIPGEPGAQGTAEAPAELPPLFLIELILQNCTLVSIPDQGQFANGIAELVAHFQETMLSTSNLVPDPYFDAFTRPFINNKFEDKTCGQGPQLRAIFEEDMQLQGIISGLQNNVNYAFNAINHYIGTFTEITDFFKSNESVTQESVEIARNAVAGDLKGVKRLQSDVDFFREGLATYHRQATMTNKIPNCRPIGLFMVDTTAFKNKVIPSPLRCLDCIHAIIPLVSRKEVDRLTQETQDAEYTLALPLSTTADYVSHLAFLRKVQLRIEPLEQEADVVRSLYELIDHFKVPSPPEDFAVYQTLFPGIERAKTAIDRALAERDGSIDKFCACLDKDIGELLHDIREAKQANPMLLDIDKEREPLLNELARVREIVDELQTRAQTYRGYQKSFKDQILARPNIRATNFMDWLSKLYPNIVKVEQPRFVELEEVSTELRLKQLLWDSITEWDQKHQKWMEADFMSLDPEDVSGTTMKFNKTVTQLEKGLPPNNVVPLLKYKVDKMRVMLPAISDMRNPALKPRHWTLLEEVIGFSMKDLPMPLNLGKLVELNAFQHSERIQEIAGMASSEASLETLLKKVEDSWKTTEFIVLPFKDSKDVFILGGTDEIQQLWDDSNINISTIASSRHVGPIRPKVDEWVNKLQLFGDTLEEWMNCQRGWMYLESIFSAPDIQRQLPSEAKSFMALDKSFKDVMRKVQKVPLAMRAATQPGLLDTFRNNNQLLEQIQKCLEAYLESKRAVFPRFYFLSNDELLSILAQTRNPLAVQPHLQKCFDAISKLEFALNPEYTENSSEPRFTNDILAMLSPEGERVSLGKGLKARGNVEEWLGKVEEAMVTNLRRQMKQAIADVYSMSREEWLTSHTNQITLTVEQLMWARSITEILDGDSDRLEGMQDYEKKSYDALNGLAKMVRGKLPKLIRMLMCSLITIDVHARDMVTEMVANQVDSLSNFDWQRQLRYYWDTEIDNCVVHMSTSRYVYGYEYLGASPRLVITPLTDRCYLCLMGALQLDLGGAPAGPAGTGKTETTKDLAKALAKQCVVFNCSDGLDYKMMGRFFSGLAQSGAWCCFDEFNRIDIEVLSVIAQQLITIRYYLRHSKDPNTRNWMIYLEGGWYCFDEATCLARQLTNQALFSSRTWHMIRYSYYFHGSRIITAVVNELLARRDFAEARKVVFAGSSAGGIGTMMNLDRLARKIRKRSRSRVQVSGIVDSAWFLNYPTYTQPSYLINCTSIYDCSPVEGIHRGIELWQPRIPRRCREAEGKSKFWRCYLGPVLYQHIHTPTFIIQSLFDEAQLQMNRALLLTGGSYTKFAYIQRLGQEMTIDSQSLHETLREWDAQMERQQQRPLHQRAATWAKRARHRFETRMNYNSSMLFLSKLVAVLNKPKVDGTEMRGGQYARVSRDLKAIGDKNHSNNNNNSGHIHGSRRQTRSVQPFLRIPVAKPATPSVSIRLIDKCSLEGTAHSEEQSTAAAAGVSDACLGRAIVTPMCNPSCRPLTHPRTMEKLNIVSLLELYGVDTFQLAANAGFSVRELKSLPVREQMRAIYCLQAPR